MTKKRSDQLQPMSQKLQQVLQGRFTDKTIVGVSDEYWERLPTLHVGHTANLVYESRPYKVWVSRLGPEDYGFGDWMNDKENQKALRIWHEEKIVIEKEVPGEGFVRLPRHRRTVHLRSR
jgi:hypothetical protein